MMLRRSLALIPLTIVLLARPSLAQLPQGISEDELEQALHLFSATQEYGYPRGRVVEKDLRLPEALRQSPMDSGTLGMLWLPIYHDYARSSAAICSFATSTVKDRFHDVWNEFVRLRPGLAVLYNGRSLQDCVEWRLRVQASMFDIVVSNVKSDAAKKLLAEYQTRSTEHLKLLGTSRNPLSDPPYPQRLQEFADVWQQFQMANR